MRRRVPQRPRGILWTTCRADQSSSRCVFLSVNVRHRMLMRDVDKAEIQLLPPQSSARVHLRPHGGSGTRRAPCASCSNRGSSLSAPDSGTKTVVELTSSSTTSERASRAASIRVQMLVYKAEPNRKHMTNTSAAWRSDRPWRRQRQYQRLAQGKTSQR